MIDRFARLELERHAREYGIEFPGACMFIKDTDERSWDYNAAHELMAMDSQPSLVSNPSGAAAPAFLYAQIDPVVLEILKAPCEATSILKERAAGTWIDETYLFPIVEHTGEVKSYGDEDMGGMASANTNYETRQNYLFQIGIRYGDREIERAGRAKIQWANELRKAVANVLATTENLFYFRGVQGLLNYGIQNDPNLYPSIAPLPKTNGGLAWQVNGAPNATPNEIFFDIETLVNQVINQSGGRVNRKSKFILALSPESDGAMAATNSFNVNTPDLIKKNYPGMEIVTAVQYGVQSAQNTQGLSVGNMAQIICPDVSGQDTGWTAFSTKMKAGPIIRRESSFTQKFVSGTWGAIIRQPFAIASMVGI